MAAMERAKAHRLDKNQIEALTKIAFVSAGDTKDKLVVNKDPHWPGRQGPKRSGLGSTSAAISSCCSEKQRQHIRSSTTSK